MSEPQRILVVDDEPQITRVLRAGLTSAGYAVRASSDGEAALEVFRDWAPALVVTDLSMPALTGLELCRRLRAQSAVPIIVLSVKQEENTKIEALDAGADDYVTKPFGMDELLARIRAALRRSPPNSDALPVLEAGDFRVDLEARRVSVRGAEVHLTPKEYDLLVHLLRHAGKVFTHRALFSAVWGSTTLGQLESLRVLVAALRKKIEPDPSSPRYLQTEPWVGYRFEPEG